MQLTSPAIVRPRVVSPQTGESLLLEEVVAAHLAANDHGRIELSGGPLAGKTTAIEQPRLANGKGNTYRH